MDGLMDGRTDGQTDSSIIIVNFMCLDFIYGNDYKYTWWIVKAKEREREREREREILVIYDALAQRQAI
jgi:hypothetical protein